jgi:hypothetical protein
MSEVQELKVMPAIICVFGLGHVFCRPGTNNLEVRDV